MKTLLEDLQNDVKHIRTVHWSGSVTEVTGNLIVSAGPQASVGEECCVSTTDGHTHRGEIIGFRGSTLLSMLTEAPLGVRHGDRITAQGARPSIRVGASLLGRVISSQGDPLDGKPMAGAGRSRPVDGLAPKALTRVPIRTALGTGIRSIDGFMTCGKGQRLGVFGGSGVGKTTLLSMMIKGTAADVIVMALVGERGREVGEFLDVLGADGLRRSVLVVSTSDESPLSRLRAPLAATAIAEDFAAQGLNVLLVVDSLTRFAMAQREIGLAAGEPPTAKGYTPSVLNKLACLVERAGQFRVGSITAFYTVLMEGDDQQDPVVDTVRSLLDGHIILDRELASRGHYPPISVPESLSRLMPEIAGSEHLEKARAFREMLSMYSRSEDLIRIGAYARGSNPKLDRAIELLPNLNQFLCQASGVKASLSQNVQELLSLAS